MIFQGLPGSTRDTAIVHKKTHNSAHCFRVSRERGREQEISASLFPKQIVNEALPVTDIHMNGIKGVALVDNHLQVKWSNNHGGRRRWM